MRKDAERNIVAKLGVGRVVAKAILERFPNLAGQTAQAKSAEAIRGLLETRDLSETGDRVLTERLSTAPTKKGTAATRIS